jgi:hypothetical protein
MVMSFFQNLCSKKRDEKAFSSPSSLDDYLDLAATIPGWVDRDELSYKAKIVNKLPTDAVIVEIGCFLGRSTVVMAGVRKLIGNGKIHVIDPFDASGDAFSVPFYKLITNKIEQPILDEFRGNITNAKLDNYIVVYKGTAETIIHDWTTPIDFLILDGDQSPAGAKTAYDLWLPLLKPGGYICLHNSGSKIHIPGHDGHRRLFLEEIKPPLFDEIHTEKQTSFARKN